MSSNTILLGRVTRSIAADACVVLSACSGGGGNGGPAPIAPVSTPAAPAAGGTVPVAFTLARTPL